MRERRASRSRSAAGRRARRCSRPRSPRSASTAGAARRWRSSPSGPGVSRGAAQHHFPTREALFTAAIDELMTAWIDDIRGHRHELPAGPGRIRAVVERIVDVYTGPAVPRRPRAVGRRRRRIRRCASRSPRSNSASDVRRTASSSSCSAPTSRSQACARRSRPPSISPADWAWPPCCPTTTADAPASSPTGSPPSNPRSPLR